MLSKKNLELVAPSAAQAANRGYSAQPVENSPLASITQESLQCLFATAPDTIVEDEKDQSERIASIVEDLEQGTAPRMGVSSIELSPHSKLLDIEVKRLVGHIKPLVRFIPNEVTPIIRELVERTSEGLQTITPDALIGKKIEVVRFPRFLATSDFATKLLSYSSREYSYRLKLIPMIEGIDKDLVVKRLETGVSSVDAELKQWLDNQGYESVLRVVEGVFGVNVFSDDKDKALEKVFVNSKEGLLNSIVVFLLADSFRLDLPENILGSSVAIKTQLEIIKNIAGYDLFRRLKILLKKREDKVLVDAYVNDTVYVYEDMYDIFLEQGGTNEMLLGAYMSNDRSYYIHGILERAEQYNKIWQQALVSIRAVEKEQRALMQEQLMIEHFHRIMLESFDEEERTKVDIAAMVRTFAKTYRALHAQDKADLAIAATKAVCEARFPNSPAKAILLNMNEIMQQNPELDPESASGMAFAMYISDWVADLIRFNKV